MGGVGPEPRPPLPGEPCQVPQRDGWSPLEKWVWQKIGSGRPADINKKVGACALPCYEDGWGPERQLSSEFLTDILLHDPWRSNHPRGVVRILGAFFTDPIDIRWTELPKALWIDRSRFLAPVRLSSVRADRDLSFSGSVFLDELLLDSARINGSLFLHNDTEFGRVVVTGASIASNLYVTRATVTELFNAESINILRSLWMQTSSFNSLVLDRITIGDDIYLENGQLCS